MSAKGIVACAKVRRGCAHPTPGRVFAYSVPDICMVIGDERINGDEVASMTE